MDAYVLIRLRLGVGIKCAHGCDDVQRAHELVCPGTADARPDPVTLYDDKRVVDWRWWWVEHGYLRLGIPPASKDDALVVAGNPFTGHLLVWGTDGTKWRHGPPGRAYCGVAYADMPSRQHHLTDRSTGRATLCALRVEARFWEELKSGWERTDLPVKVSVVLWKMGPDDGKCSVCLRMFRGTVVDGAAMCETRAGAGAGIWGSLKDGWRRFE
ncbi:hypothetical protein C7212DRAFT_346454 [Tuber magnatum]|uniref:Uncharacterized protein n=1 Tax=Tuber magnatum TaxID=42249 RepID=A0A317SKB0_9PEZI|nr:hypothetical protein C7212DRAFT_346454 [Tuber magnatum]